MVFMGTYLSITKLHLKFKAHHRKNNAIISHKLQSTIRKFNLVYENKVKKILSA